MIRPYYEHKGITIYHGDCLDILPQLDKVDLVLTDPPYGIGESNQKNLSRGKWAAPTNYGDYDWDKNKLNDEYIMMVLDISKNQIIFGGNYYGKILGDTSCYIVWDKDNGNNDFADCELAWTSFKSAVRIVKWRWNGMLQENMKNKDYRSHPTQKPLGLFKWILKNYSKETYIILDPFMGSGTTLVACKDLNRKAIGIEIEEKYCEIAAKRLSQEVFEFK